MQLRHVFRHALGADPLFIPPKCRGRHGRREALQVVHVRTYRAARHAVVALLLAVLLRAVCWEVAAIVVADSMRAVVIMFLLTPDENRKPASNFAPLVGVDKNVEIRLCDRSSFRDVGILQGNTKKLGTWYPYPGTRVLSTHKYPGTKSTGRYTSATNSPRRLEAPKLHDPIAM